MEQVQPVAAYEQVVDQVKRAIFLGRFLPGDKLPPERELARQLGVSRTTVREAVRALGGEGLVTSRRGAAGGITVEPFEQLEQRTIDSIRRDIEKFEDLLDFRVSVEGAAARLAAERRTKQDIQRLGEGVAAMREIALKLQTEQGPADVANFFALDCAFHLAIGKASRNPYLRQAIEDARTNLFYPIGSIFAHLADNADRSHEELFKAINDRDPEAAEQAARDHIEATRTDVRQIRARALRGR